MSPEQKSKKPRRKKDKAIGIYSLPKGEQIEGKQIEVDINEQLENLKHPGGIFTIPSNTSAEKTNNTETLLIPKTKTNSG